MTRVAAIVLILGVCLPEMLRAGVVLKAGEIDSSKVRVGAFAEVVYGKGKRDPVSGVWEKLARASGYIKAVDAQHLTLALKEGFGRKQIAFARIQKLLLAASSYEMAWFKNTAGTDTLFVRTDASRMGSKLAMGAAAGVGLGFLGGMLGNLGEDDCEDAEGEICVDEEFALGVLSGYLAGVSVGVSIVDPRDRFIASLGGSLIGFGVGVIVTIQQEDLWPSLLICPVAGATALSELTRKSPEARRVSVGLAPDPNRSLSAVATLSILSKIPKQSREVYCGVVKSAEDRQGRPRRLG